jgi:penicillin-binding protein 1A
MEKNTISMVMVLKIYTTIDSKDSAEHAEEAVKAHMKIYKKNFGRNKKEIKTLHFLNITDAETDKIMNQAMKNSERWSVLKSLEKTDEEIIASFKVKTKMRVLLGKVKEIPL